MGVGGVARPRWRGARLQMVAGGVRLDGRLQLPWSLTRWLRYATRSARTCRFAGRSSRGSAASAGIGRVGPSLGCEETELWIRARRAYPGGAVLHVPTAASNITSRPSA